MSEAIPVKKEVRWRAAEFERVERGLGWYWSIGIAAAFLVLFALWQRSFFFLLFVVLVAGVFALFSRRRPRIYDFAVTDDGIEIGPDIRYQYDQLADFDARERPGRLDELVIRRKRAANPFVRLPIDSQTAKDAVALLTTRLPRVSHEESLFDVLVDFLGF